jgi:DNA helicase IV
VVATVRRALDAEGSIGVIAPDAAVAALGAALSRAGIQTATADEVESETRVTLLPATVAKGLEYDHVVVVEPADIVAAEPRGLNRLYVVLTRAVSRLDIVHAKPLPAGLSAKMPG